MSSGLFFGTEEVPPRGREGGRRHLIGWPIAGSIGAVALIVSTAVSATAELRPPQSKHAVRQISAQAQIGKVRVSGWAIFSDQMMAGTKDPDDDAAVGGDANGAEIIGSDFIYRPEREDFFFRLEVTKIPTVGGGTQGVGVGSPLALYALRLTAKNVAYEIRAHSIGGVKLDPHSFGLFRCEETTCREVAPLKGGYGTGGERVVVALPLQVLRDDGTKIAEGDSIGGLYAFTANAPYLGPAARTEQMWDDARLTRRAALPVPRRSVTVTVGGRSVRAKLDPVKLKDTRFEASFPKRLFSGKKTVVRTATCLGKLCKRQRFQVSRAR